ncbi:MAG: nucleotidyltransferase family protein [Deltaproteobacteria bacterium]|nr:nucleotidyltransferase family protein [Deltaproteobacteria bacterium]MBI3294157.1 nucleotidyltransferase family protein [Deltaproteobacteria bacterium]
MRAVILAGGLGTRLRPYTTVLPKPLMPIGDTPILEVLVRQLARHKICELTVTLGHLGKLIRTYFGDGSHLGVRIDYSMESQPLGTMGPLKLIPDLPEDFLVLNGDILTDLSFSDFFRKHRESGAGFTISSFPREVETNLGVLETNETGQLVGFREKPKLPFEASMGIYALKRSVVDDIPAGRPFGFDDLMLQLIQYGKFPNVIRHEGFWLDVGRHEDFERAQVYFTDLKSSLLEAGE